MRALPRRKKAVITDRVSDDNGHFRGVRLGDLRVGDVIRSTVFCQSRTGYIFCARLRGRIQHLTFEQVPDGQSPAYAEGLLRNRHGVVQPFKLSAFERVVRETAVR